MVNIKYSTLLLAILYVISMHFHKLSMFSGDRDREDIVSGDGICKWGRGLWLSSPPRADEGERGKSNFTHIHPFLSNFILLFHSSSFSSTLMYFHPGAGKVPSDCVRRPVLPPEEDHPQGPEGREPPARQRDEHQDRRLRFQQRIRDREQVGHVLRVSTLCRAWAVPGKEIRWTWGWCLVPWCDTLYSRWGQIWQIYDKFDKWLLELFERSLLQSVAACPLTAPPWGNWGGKLFHLSFSSSTPPSCSSCSSSSSLHLHELQGNFFFSHFPPSYNSSSSCFCAVKYHDSWPILCRETNILFSFSSYNSSFSCSSSLHSH